MLLEAFGPPTRLMVTVFGGLAEQQILLPYLSLDPTRHVVNVTKCLNLRKYMPGASTLLGWPSRYRVLGCFRILGTVERSGSNFFD